MSDHTRYQDDIGAYLLGALNEIERKAFERHIAGCGECQEELAGCGRRPTRCPARWSSCKPPPRLKASLMEVVEREASRRAGAGRGAPALQPPARHRGRLLIGLVVGFAVAQLGGEDDTRTLAATVDSAMPQAGGTLRVAGDDARCASTTCPTSVPHASTRCGSSTETAWFPRGHSRSARAERAGSSCATCATRTELRDARAARRRSGAERGPDCERASVR